MVSTNWARTCRRAAGRLRPGGKHPCEGAWLGGRVEHRIAPDQADQGEMTVQPGPTAALVVAEPQFLLAIFMEAFHAPAPMRQAQLVFERAAIQAPGEVPFGVAALARQRALPQQPPTGPGHGAMGPVDAHPAPQPFGGLPIRIE